MGGCIGKSSYGPWRSNTARNTTQEKPKKVKKDKLYISIREEKFADDKKVGGGDSCSKSTSSSKNG